MRREPGTSRRSLPATLACVAGPLALFVALLAVVPAVLFAFFAVFLEAVLLKAVFLEAVLF